MCPQLMCKAIRQESYQKKTFQMGETLAGAKISYLDINMEKKIADERLRELEIQNVCEKETTRAMKDLGVERAKLHGWPNTYSFTKAMGEMLLQEFKEKAKVIIIRPAIITSTYAEPFPGWIDRIRTMDSIYVPYGRGELKMFLCDPESTLDLIPGDMVVNAMLAAMASHSTQPSRKLMVYHIGSSLRNPIKIVHTTQIAYHYFTKNPMLDDRGKPIRVAKLKTLDSMASFRKYIAIRYQPFLFLLGVINIIFCNQFKSVHANAEQRINRLMRIIETYEPYVLFLGVFDDYNTETLRRTIRESSMDFDVLNFDPKCIGWEEYLVGTHFPGVVKYALK